MAIETLGKPQVVVERIEIDRVGFVTASVKKTLKADGGGGDIDSYFNSGGGVGIVPPYKTIFGAVCTRATAEGDFGIATIRWLYEGIATWVGDNDPKYYYCNYDRSLNTVPIQAHPEFKSKFLGKYGTLDESGNWLPFASISTTVNQDGSKALYNANGTLVDDTKNPLLGTESYYTAGGVWSVRYAARNLEEDILDGIGSIIATEDLPQNDEQKPPKVPVDKNTGTPRNWLYVGPVTVWRGNAWDVNEQYILSGRGGWVPIVYDGSSN